MTTVESALQAALAHHHAGRLAEAEDAYRRILAQSPSHAGALHLLGVIALQKGRHADAIASIREAIAVNSRQAAFHNNLGEAYRALGEIAEAQSSYQRAIGLEPAFAEAHNNLGLALQTAGDVAAAASQFERAIQIRPDNVEAHYNLSRVLLLQGDFERGWREYAWRLRIPGHPSQRMAAPKWDGLPLAGKRLLIYAEQGFGDTLQFIRYLSRVKSRAGKTVVAVPAKLISLLTASGFDNLLPLDSPTPACDAQCSLLDLPALWGTTLASIPASRHTACQKSSSRSTLQRCSAAKSAAGEPPWGISWRARTSRKKAYMWELSTWASVGFQSGASIVPRKRNGAAGRFTPAVPRAGDLFRKLCNPGPAGKAEQVEDALLLYPFLDRERNRGASSEWPRS